MSASGSLWHPDRGPGPESLGELEPALEHRVIRSRRRSLGEGSLACPCCELPLSLGDALPLDAEVSCGYCAHRAALAGFLRPGARDAPGNRVRLTARG